MPGVYASKDIGMALFDLESDPGEERDVSSTNPDIVAKLSVLIDEARKKIGDREIGIFGSEAREPGRVDVPWHVQIAR